MKKDIDRRTFIRTLAAGGGSVLLGVWLNGCSNEDSGPTTSAMTTTSTEGKTKTATTVPQIIGDPSTRWDADLYLRIDGDETVTITVPKSDMGQGVRTSLAMIVAEELDAEWANVRVETASAGREYGDQVTGGSLSISTRFDSMRWVGARARHMLIAAAAAEWGVAPDACTTEPGVVVGPGGDRRATYGTLASLVADIEPPSTAEVIRKDPADFRIIGTPVTIIDAPDMVTGAAMYGSDVALPDMLLAAVARSPIFGGRATSFDESPARAIPGVRHVVEISTGIAVVADNTWAALRGRDALEVSWDGRGDESLDDASIRKILFERLAPADTGPGEITADYVLPYFPHSAIEPLVCVAGPTDDGLEVWAATQDPQQARAIAARGAGVASDAVTLRVPLIGGGFGRRLDQDFVEEAAEIAAAVGGPIKLVWSRTDDLRHDVYQPAAVCRAVGNPSDPGGRRLDIQLAWNDGVPTGNWRSVTNVPDAFFHQCFLDELANTAGADPFEYRRDLLNDSELETLELAATSGRWSDPLPAGWGQGIAFHSMWGVTPAAAVAEVSVEGTAIRLHRVVIALDCGTVVNPDSVVAQMEGSVAFAASAALHGGITVTRGGVAESNFSDAPILRFDEMPDVEVHIVPSNGPPSGVGEAGVPPIAPAIANAVFAATGRRLRELPLTLG